MKGSRGLARLYDRLTPEERFRLVLEALARGDEAESNRLAGVCPRKTYEMNDLAYGNRLRATRLIASYVCSEVECALEMLRTVDVFRECVSLSLDLLTREGASRYHRGWRDGCDLAWRAAGQPGSFPWKADELAARIEETEERAGGSSEAEEDPGAALEHLGRTLAARVATIWEVFSRFCRAEIGLEPETVALAMHPRASTWIEEVREAMYDSSLVDRVLLEECEVMLVRVWHELVDRT